MKYFLHVKRKYLVYLSHHFLHKVSESDVLSLNIRLHVYEKSNSHGNLCHLVIYCTLNPVLIVSCLNDHLKQSTNGSLVDMQGIFLQLVVMSYYLITFSSVLSMFSVYQQLSYYSSSCILGNSVSYYPAYSL